MAPSAAVKSAQLILRAVEPALMLDGRWGSYTDGVYMRAPLELRTHVDAVLNSASLSRGALHNANIVAKQANTADYRAVKMSARVDRAIGKGDASREEVDRAIKQASEATGVSRDLLWGFAALESSGRSSVENGSSRGLMQMQPAAWLDAAKFVPIGDYAKNWRDPYQNALAGAAYLRINTSRLQKLGFPDKIDAAVLYLAHQQGAGGVIELARAAKKLPATTNYVGPEALKRNPPPDGQGITLDKASFYNRWMTIARRRLNGVAL